MIYYYVALLLLLAVYALFYVFTWSYISLIFTAIREDEDAVAAVDVSGVKLIVSLPEGVLL